MKTLMIACSVVALAAATGIATSNRAEAFFLPGFTKLFGPVVGKHCQRIATHLPNPPYVWVCKENSLPWWWSRNEFVPTVHDQRPNSSPVKRERNCEQETPG